jgi:flagellar biosynthesis/type III secretory pathway protein FliH
MKSWTERRAELVDLYEEGGVPTLQELLDLAFNFGAGVHGKAEVPHLAEEAEHKPGEQWDNYRDRILSMLETNKINWDQMMALARDFDASKKEALSDEIARLKTLIQGEDEQYRRGYKDGYGVGRDSGLAIGNIDGYKDGQTAGFEQGVKVGVGDRLERLAEFEKGRKEGYEQGNTEGLKADGYMSGLRAGYKNGHTDGYNKGKIDTESGAEKLRLQAYWEGYGNGCKDGRVDGEENVKGRVRSNVERLFEDGK